MEAFYKKKEEEVLEALKTDGSKGLSSAAARERLEEYGANELAEGKKNARRKTPRSVQGCARPHPHRGECDQLFRR